MDKQIVALTHMTGIPESCLDCINVNCNLPMKSRGPEGSIKKAYLTKRHKDCPLRLVEENHLKGVK